MRTVRNIYHWSMAAFPLLGIAYLLASMTRLLINKGDIFYMVCLSVIAIAVSNLLLIPAIKDLQKYRKGESK